MVSLNDYAPIVGPEVIGQLKRLAEVVAGRRFVNINSTRTGGGVAEILNGAVPLLNQLDIKTQWEVIQGDPFFFEITKAMRKLGLTQKAAAERMGIPQPKVSAMLHGDFTNLSERKLMDCLNRLGYDIEIKVRPATNSVGHLMLAFA